MKKSLAILLIPALMVGTKVFADQASSTPSVSSTPSSTSSTSAKTKSSTKKKKKATAEATPVATPVPTVSTSSTTTTPKKTASTVSSLFSANMDLYDRLGAPGDLRQAISLAANNYGSSPRHDRSVFLWLGKVTGGDAGKNAFIRFNIDSIELGGAKKPWIVLTGAVADQSGSDCKTGDMIEVAVDFRDVKVDYEGTKLGEVQ